VDCAILVITGNQFGDEEVGLIHQFEAEEVPYLIIHNKNDIRKIASTTRTTIREHTHAAIIDVSTFHTADKDVIIRALKCIVPETAYQQRSLMGDLIQPKDIVLLITPIDSEAPEGRLILPQNQAIRDALDNDCITVVVKQTELADFLTLGITPALAVTDSQAFGYVARILPDSIPLTSFSILFARMKGDFAAYEGRDSAH